jgi:excinuclease UvrABC helicase subunit UvrB
MIYVIRGDILKENVYKIGMTKNADIPKLIKRYQTYYGDGLEPYVRKTSKFKELELAIHRDLDEYRICPKRELFECDMKIIIASINKLMHTKPKPSRLKRTWIRLLKLLKIK